MANTKVTITVSGQTYPNTYISWRPKDAGGGGDGFLITTRKGETTADDNGDYSFELDTLSETGFRYEFEIDNEFRRLYEVIVPASPASTSLDALLIGGTVLGDSVQSYIDTALAGIIEDQIVDGVTAKAPSQNAVFDALALYQPVSAKNQANGYAGLDGTGLLDPSVFPALKSHEFVVVADQAARLALTASDVQLGDEAFQTDTGETHKLIAADPSLLGSWQIVADTTPDWSAIQNKPNFSAVATSGNYDDLANLPNLAPLALTGSWDDVTSRPTLVSQAEAEAGTGTAERIWSATRVKQAIAALGSSVWTIAGADIYFNTGNVGVGTASPQKLWHLKKADTHQARFEYSAGIHTDLGTNSSGDYNLSPTNQLVSITGDLELPTKAGVYNKQVRFKHTNGLICGISSPDGESIHFNSHYIAGMIFKNQELKVGSTGVYGWSNQANYPAAARDTGITRHSAAVAKIIDAGTALGGLLVSHLGVGTESPNANAIADLVSTTKAFLPPRMTTAQKTAISAAAGMQVFDTDLSKMCVYTGSAWETITSS